MRVYNKDDCTAKQKIYSDSGGRSSSGISGGAELCGATVSIIHNRKHLEVNAFSLLPYNRVHNLPLSAMIIKYCHKKALKKLLWDV